jgi:hypothetical protein
VGTKPDANASTKMGKQLLKGKKKKGKNAIFRHREVDLTRLYTDQDLNQLQYLPARTAKQVVSAL